jgi:hypothetical protein
MCLKRITTTLRTDTRITMNKELFDRSRSKGFFLPTEHGISGMDFEMLCNDFKKFSKPIFWCPIETKLELTCRAFRKLFDPVLFGTRMFTLDEAIQIAEKNTSPGYLYKKIGCVTKQDVFLKHRSLLESQIALVFEGVNVETIAQAAPKVEIRPLEKIGNPDPELNKQRTFCVVDTLNYIICIMLYGHQNHMLHTHKTSRHWSAVGSTIFYGGIDSLANNLTSNSKSQGRIKCFDIKSMEASISETILMFIYEWRNSTAALASARNATQWFTQNKIYTLLIDLHGYLCMMLGMNPSGCGNTLDDNTFVLIWLKLYHISQNCSTIDQIIEIFWETPSQTMGDDDISADLPVWDGYEKTALTVGFRVTNEIPGECTLKNAKFLNFGFLWIPQRSMYVFKPNYDKLFANLYFNRKSDSWRLTLAKLYALRVLCFADLSRRNELENMIAYIWDEHDSDLISEIFLESKIPYKTLRNMCLADDEIGFLLYGDESGSFSDDQFSVTDIIYYSEN